MLWNDSFMDCLEILLIHPVTLPPSQDKKIDLLFAPFISFYPLKLQPILFLVEIGSISSGRCGGSPGSGARTF